MFVFNNIKPYFCQKNMEYINKGICIFCKKNSTETSFFQKPHTLPKSLGGINIGIDICDKCNHYFGEPDELSMPHLSIEVCVKEIFSLMRILLLSTEKGDTSILKSIYFSFYKSKGIIKLKSQFQFNDIFLKTFARQFKRGLYEIFLQEYHLTTLNGLDERFDPIRRFARYNEGDIPVYHIRHNGIILIEKDMLHPSFRFSNDQYNSINKYGFYTLILFGNWFLLEVTPEACKNREIYLSKIQEELHVGNFVMKDIITLQRITDIDFTLRSLFK